MLFSKKIKLYAAIKPIFDLYPYLYLKSILNLLYTNSFGQKLDSLKFYSFSNFQLGLILDFGYKQQSISGFSNAKSDAQLEAKTNMRNVDFTGFQKTGLIQVRERKSRM